MNRTDAALVRLTTPVFSNETEADADARLRAMVPEFVPALSAYLPALTSADTRRAKSPEGNSDS